MGRGGASAHGVEPSQVAEWRTIWR